MEIERVQNLSKEDFLKDYLTKNKPVVITDGMKNWNIERFQPESLSQEFGGEITQIYDDLFDLQNVASLESYLKNNFNQPEKECKQYIRWYTKLKDVDFLWSDHVFEKLQDAWSHPEFLPKRSLLIPTKMNDEEMDITKERFPYKGLFISGKGARTRLHRDPFNSNAMLCQFYGEKDVILYSPEQAPFVMNGTDFVNVKSPDLAKFPNFPKAQPTYELTLKAGEIILFPSGWFHDVTCATDSVSITWNFIHASGFKDFRSFVLEHPEDDQLEIVRFFLGGLAGENADMDEIVNVLESRITASAL
ncbi:cupin-like domain-containing protein [Flavobacteriaceae bacterium M23B6Z8]